MDRNPFGPIPWDILVFVALTGMGFAFSVQRYVQSRPARGVSVRAVASPAQPRSSARSVELGCLEKRLLTERFEAFGREIRLSGQFCHLTRTDMSRFLGLRVRNMTTDQESTIFFQGDGGEFRTDTLALTPGRNLIRLEWREAADVPPRELTAEIVAR